MDLEILLHDLYAKSRDQTLVEPSIPVQCWGYYCYFVQSKIACTW